MKATYTVITTEYHYDYEDFGQSGYGTNNNRLMFSETFAAGNPTPTNQTWYVYNRGGHVRQIISKDAS